MEERFDNMEHPLDEEPLRGAYAHEPLALRPLRLRGVFGAAWQAYKRGFVSMLVLTLLLVGLVGVLAQLAVFGSFGDLIASMEGMAPGPDADEQMIGFMGRIFGGIGLLSLFSGVTTFLLSPMYAGTAGAEFARRMRGGASNTKALLKACGKGLKRYYTTFLALWVTRMGIQLVLTIFIWIAMIFGVIGLAVSGAFSGEPSLSSVVGFVLMMLLIVLVAVIAEMFLSFVYPVAVNEEKLHFKAVGRSFKLVGRRFWRVLGVTLLATLIVGLIISAAVIPAAFLGGDPAENMTGFLLLSAVSIGVGALLGPWMIAIQHALYYDAAAREQALPFDPTEPIPEDAPPPAPRPSRRYDPMTGEPLYRFDPRTGEPIEPVERPPFPFDPRTGEVILPEEQEEEESDHPEEP